MALDKVPYLLLLAAALLGAGNCSTRLSRGEPGGGHGMSWDLPYVLPGVYRDLPWAAVEPRSGWVGKGP